MSARLLPAFRPIGVADARAGSEEGPCLHVACGTTAARVAAYMRDTLLPHLLRAEDVMSATAQAPHASVTAAKGRNRRRLRP